MKRKIANELVLYCKKLKKLGFLAGFSGNLSIKTGKDSFMITPSGIDKGEIKPKDIIEMSFDGSVYGKEKPSSEWKMHSFLYTSKASPSAIIHTHPPFISFFSCSSIKIEKPLMAEFIITLGGLPKTPYFTPGSSEVEKSLAKYATKSKVLILSNHGLVAFGSNLKNAFALTEEAEHFAKIYYLSILAKKTSSIKKKKIPPLIKLAENFSF